MISSLNQLLSSEYNKHHKAFALRRYLYWKWLRLTKAENVKYSLWNNRKIFLNYDSFQSMWIMYNYIVDWEEFNFIKRFVKGNHQVCDIGSNMGFYTIWMLQFVKDGKIHSFEPDKSNFERLRANVLLNKSESTVAMNNAAVSDIDGVLHFTTGLDGENHIDRSGSSELSVTSLKLDTYAREHRIKLFDYVKIDVEGFEYFVLKGAEELLSSNRISVLQLEINSTVKNSQTDVEDILYLLTSYGYSLCRYDVKANQLIPVDFNESRENYLATCDILSINKQLTSA